MLIASVGLLAFSAWIASAGGEAIIPEGWIKVSVGSLLTVEAPQGTHFQPENGADSFVGTLAGPGFKLQLDYGAYSDPLTDQSRFTGYSTQTILIDGKSATIVRATLADPSSTPGRFIGLHLPQLGKSGRGSLSLTLSGVVTDSKQEALVGRIFDTIRFMPTL